MVPVFLAAGEMIFLFPYVVSLRFFHPVRTSYMLQRPGPVVLKWRPLNKIAPTLKRAVVNSEDALFYRHHGVDFHEMEASWKKNLRKRKYARGFSTITMQLARNLFLMPDKNLLRKGLEIVIALQMELVLPKDRILELYLNLVEWGKGIYGAEAAARHYFKKPAADLNPDEAAFLASILPNPRKWGQWPPGPYVNRRKGAILARIGHHQAIRKRAAPEEAVPEEILPEEEPAEPIPDLPENGEEHDRQIIPESL